MQIPLPPRCGSGAVESAHVLLDALTRLGLRHLVICPGSRSAPLVYAAHALGDRAPRIHVRHDERAAAFTALGMGRAGQLAAVITTSGTAVAHLLAATMEAHHSRIPLILLTADRPAELRGTGANQTTMQPGIFGGFARCFDLPAPTANAATATELRLAADTAARAIAVAQGTPGPVHLNTSFRDPLTPSGPSEPPRGRTDALSAAERSATEPAPSGLQLEPRTLVIAGDADAATGELASAVATRFNLPLLAEPSSQARSDSAPLVPAYPLALREVMGSSEHDLRPRHVLVFGHPTLSRPVARDLLNADDVAITVVSDSMDWPDIPRRASCVIPGLDLGSTTLAGSEPEYAEQWRKLGERLRSRARTSAVPQAVAALAVWSECAQDGAALVVGASALIRDLDILAGPTSAPVYANRGLAGIDGTFSTASGVALARKAGVDPGRTRVLVGDVTSIHDLTGLVIGPTEEEPDLDIVIVDDNGGRIFGGLEHASAPADLLERFFTTPHGLDLAAVVGALGIDAVRTNPTELASALRGSSHEPGRRAFIVTV